MLVRSIVLLLLSACSLIAGLWLRSQYNADLPGNILAKVEENIQSEFEIIDQEALLLLSEKLSPASSAWDEVSHYFVYVDSMGIRAWSRNSFMPDPASWLDENNVTFASNHRGEFLMKKWQVDNGFLVCQLTLKDRYQITNNFLKPAFNAEIFPIDEVDVVSPSGIGEPVSFQKKTIFRLLISQPETQDSHWSFGALLVALILLFAGLYGFGRDLEKRWGCDTTLFMLLAAFFGIRYGMIQLGIPALYFHSPIFDPRIFASSSLNVSMGDLLFNGLSVFFAVLYLFRNFNRMELVRWLLRRTRFQRFLAGSICLLAAFYGLLFSFNFIEVIYHNSAQSLDITQSLSMDWVRMTALLSVLIGTVSAFLFIHVLVVMARHLLSAGLISFLLGLTLAALLFVVQYTWADQDYHITALVGILFFALLRLLNFDRIEFKFSFKLFIYLIFSLTIFSIHHSMAVRSFYVERQVRDQFGFAKDFLAKRDVLAEYLLNQARQRIEEDQFIKARMGSLFLSKTSVIDKVRKIHLHSYFDRYEVGILTRMSNDSGIFKDVGMGSGRTTFLPTGYQGITYSEISTADAVKRYHVSIPIYYQRPVGSVELELVLKRVVPDNVFPELLVDNRFSQIYRNRDFSYALFEGSRLSSSSGSFNYERYFDKTTIGLPEMYREGVKDHGYFHVAVEEVDGSTAIVSAPTYSWSSVVTNVCFWFVIGLALMLMVQGAIGFYSVLKGRRFDFTARIQVYMFLAFALPVVAVSVTTLTLLGKSSEEATGKDFLDRSASASQSVAGLFSGDSTAAPTRLEPWIVENAAFSKTDISIYSPEGNLMATSQPALFESHLLSARINREAWRKIVLEGERQTVTSEQIGGLQYSCAYAAVLSPRTGSVAAVVSLPFFESATFLQRGQILILSNILKVFVVVFLVFSILSFWAASSLTEPIRLFTKTLRQTTFSGNNKRLQWNTSDEIGMLVKEYNRMVENLEGSKRALAQNEKESAWREMAKQVAHEINNPLTPMKLTLQQMEQGLRSGAFSSEKTEKSVGVLLKQVEILNSIASSFSTLARMPAPFPQRVELSKLLNDTVTLFSTDNKIKISCVVQPPILWVSVDPTSFSRVLSNILINAFQAKQDERPMVVNMTALKEGESVVVAIADNGKGIAADDQARVFQPQFTTKQSGSGLGLALAKQIVVQAGGRIWFESTPGHGTTFFIELPLIHNS